jgi:hypothetical protein
MIDSHASASPAHLPWFVAAPGQTDVLLIIMGVFLVVFTLLIGVLMLRLHHLPEHIAGKEQKVQFQIVAVLSLLAMFTHENILWIAALLLAIVDLPDFTGVFNRIAQSVGRIAWKKRSKPSSSPAKQFTRGHS